MTTATENVSYIGVNLITEEVTSIARYPELVVDAYMLKGVHGENLDGTIYLSTEDQSFNGRRALAIALEGPQNIGLGWTFKVR